MKIKFHSEIQIQHHKEQFILVQINDLGLKL